MPRAKPNRAPRGGYHITLTPEVHAQSATMAQELGTTLSSLIEQCLRAKLVEFNAQKQELAVASANARKR